MFKKSKMTKSAISIIIFLVVWIGIVEIFKVPSIYIPAPKDIFRAFLELRPNLGIATLASLRITMSGFIIGMILGVGTGLLMAYSRSFMDIAGPFMEFTRPIPIFALIPLFMIWFGLGLMPQILLVAIGVSGVLGVQTYEAIRNIPVVYINASSNLGASKKVVFRTVILPYIIPHIIGGIRVAAATSWGLDVAAEFMGVQVGLGYMMIIQQMYLNTAGLVVIILIYSVLAIILDQIIRQIEKRATKWTERSEISFDKIR